MLSFLIVKIKGDLRNDIFGNQFFPLQVQNDRNAHSIKMFRNECGETIIYPTTDVSRPWFQAVTNLLRRQRRRLPLKAFRTSFENSVYTHRTHRGTKRDIISRFCFLFRVPTHSPRRQSFSAVR